MPTQKQLAMKIKVTIKTSSMKPYEKHIKKNHDDIEKFLHEIDRRMAFMSFDMTSRSTHKILSGEFIQFGNSSTGMVTFN